MKNHYDQAQHHKQDDNPEQDLRDVPARRTLTSRKRSAGANPKYLQKFASLQKLSMRVKQDTSIWFWEDQSQEQLQKMMDKLPPFRREKAQSYKFVRDRVLCAKSYLMLCDILKEKYRTLRMPDFEFSPGGKPYLKGSRLFFNLSHCPGGILCVVSDSEVGCDIEEVPETLDMDVCRLCFNGKEMDMILAAENPNVEFARLWTVKEAYLKLTGEGLTDSLPEVLSGSVLSRVVFSTELHIEHGCVSTIASYL